MIFKYHHIADRYGVAHVPLLDIKLENPKNKKSFSFNYPCLIDSGAATCVFHAGMGEILGLKVKKGKQLPLKGISPDAGIQYLHEVQIIIVDMGLKFTETVGFTHEFAKDVNSMFPYGILGQNGFFDKFKIKFDLSRGIFEIK